MGTVTNKEIAKARKQLDKIRSNPELMEKIRLEEAYEMNVNSAIDWAEKQGIEQGEKSKQLEIAKKMKDEGISSEIIQRTTGLSAEEIEEL